jgi:predicted glycosyltransferase
MKILVYSHDTFGLGNIRRMLSICQHLLDNLSNLSILLISGSPVLHRLRLPQGLDYIKLPCVGRDESGEMSVTYLGGNTQEMSRLRSDLILTAVFNFQPDLILVDKKPYGIQGELKATLHYLKKYRLPTKLVLLLRDILDTPESTIKEWCSLGNYQALEHFYDQILVVGTPEIFDVVEEYQFPYTLARKVKFCGYIQRNAGLRSREEILRELSMQPTEKLVFVTSGGGADGAKLLETYLASLGKILGEITWKSLLLTGTEMPLGNQEKILGMASQFSCVAVAEFSDDINSYFNGADSYFSR